jgi:hypothetical protein
MNHMLQNRAHAAKVSIETARTPMEKHNARADGLRVRDDLQKQIADDTALAIFKTAQPQSIAGAWSAPVHDRPVFMIGPGGSKITDPIALPDGTRAAPNPQGQIVVPMPMVAAMIVRGFIRANSVITHPDATRSDPPRPNV